MGIVRYKEVIKTNEEFGLVGIVRTEQRYKEPAEYTDLYKRLVSQMQKDWDGWSAKFGGEGGTLGGNNKNPMGVVRPGLPRDSSIWDYVPVVGGVRDLFYHLGNNDESSAVMSLYSLVVFDLIPNVGPAIRAASALGRSATRLLLRQSAMGPAWVRRIAPATHSGPLRAVTREGMVGYNSQNIGRLELARDLLGTTSTSTEIARGIQNGEIGVNILGEGMFERAYRLRFGNLEGIQGTAAFAYGEQIYLRRGSVTLLADAVHECKHALDFIRGFQGSTLQWENRAWFAEREYLGRLGLPSTYLDGPPIPSRRGCLLEIFDRYGP